MEPTDSHDTQPVTAAAPRHLPRLIIESVLIVLSVLLGFAANEWHDRSADRVLATQATESFRNEIQQNMSLLRSAEPLHAKMAVQLNRDSAATGGEAGFDAFRAAMPQRNISIPQLSDGAWQTAVSTGALRLLDYRLVSRLSNTYAAQQSAVFMTGQRIEERLTSPDNFDPAARRRMIRAQAVLFQELSGQERYLIELYGQALQSLDSARR
jgi:hypothetical protein